MLLVVTILCANNSFTSSISDSTLSSTTLASLNDITAKISGGNPVGTIIAWPVAQNPEDMENWLECNGQAVNQAAYPELHSIIGAHVPDLRGQFLRGLGGNSGTLGAVQIMGHMYLIRRQGGHVALEIRQAGCTGLLVPSLEHKHAIQEIIKAHADLGRIGGLFKQAIAADGDKFVLQRLLREVDAGMRELKAAAMRIR